MKQKIALQLLSPLCLCYKKLAIYHWRYVITVLTKEFDESETVWFTYILMSGDPTLTKYYGARQCYSRSLTLLTAETFWETATVLSEYRGDCKSRFSCIVRDRWKQLRTGMISQNTLKTQGLTPTLYTSSFDRKRKFVLLRSEIPSSMCAKLRTVVASNNRDHPTRPLYYCLFAPRIYIVVLRAHPVPGESHIQRNATGEVVTVG